MKKVWYVVLFLSLILAISGTVFYFNRTKVFKSANNNVIEKEEIETSSGEEPEKDLPELEKPTKTTQVKINAVGDCTLGSDPKFGYSGTFIEAYDKNGADYFFKGMQELFFNDDLTITNLEGTFTDSNDKVEKAFNFKGPKEYVNILKKGSIEAVNIANNHTFDYGEVGYNDTIATLKDADVKYFGYENYYIFTKDDIKIGLAGFYTNYDNNWREKIDDAISYFKDMKVNAIIMSFHWGIEKVYNQNDSQREIAHYAIDKGVDLVLGHHPHFCPRY